MRSRPTVVLIHGAFTDASVWRKVIPNLLMRGFSVVAPALPLRGLQTDAEYLSAFVDTLESEFILVGHSYAGSVISHPLLKTRGLKSLVFVSGFIQDAGETAGELNGRWPGSKLVGSSVAVLPYPGGNDLYLKPEHFAEVYAGDLTQSQVALLAATQRPIDPTALSEVFFGEATWRTVPSFALVSTEDQSIPAAAQRALAGRANAQIREVRASHASPLSAHRAVTELVEAAAA